MKRISLALSSILLTSATALAQLNTVWSSIDLSVAQAGHVVIGSIAEMGEASAAPNVTAGGNRLFLQWMKR
jgi:hypothetical protein